MFSLFQNAKKEDIWVFFNVLGGQGHVLQKEDVYGKPIPGSIGHMPRLGYCPLIWISILEAKYAKNHFQRNRYSDFSTYAEKKKT